MKYSYSDTIAGYVKTADKEKGSYTVTTSDGGSFEVVLTPSTYACMVRNLEEGYLDATGKMKDLLVPGQFFYAYGIFYPDGKGKKMEAKALAFPCEKPDSFRHEEDPKWWIQQIASVGKSFIKWQFDHPGKPIDYKNYRTLIHLNGVRKGDMQETDTVSRMIYGLASAYMLTGDEAFLEASEKGTEYMRDQMQFSDPSKDLLYWYHGVRMTDKGPQKVVASENGEDYGTIPCYEQIYALAGPVQTYRITGDPRILHDAEKTIQLFNKHYKDNDKGGYFSHLDPATLDPKAPALDKSNNRARKNWNSVGDHAPAYLINLWLATGDKKHADFLEDTFDTIEKYFQDYEHSPFVQEKFYEDWTHDKTWGWQQNRGVVGHNLKIAWNLMRMNSLKPKGKYVKLAEKIAKLMPKVGADRLRGGWYDVVERVKAPGEKQYRFVWHDRKAWWQQEQGILAYLILHGCRPKPDYLKHARESAAFYNAFYLDHADGAVYFNVLANGLPYLLGTERMKGSHSMSAYHSIELGFLAAVYTNLLITKKPMQFYFKPRPDGFKNRILRVSPDILPKGSVRLTAVEIDGKAYQDFNAEELTVKLPNATSSVRVKVTISPV